MLLRDDLKVFFGHILRLEDYIDAENFLLTLLFDLVFDGFLLGD